MSIDTVLALIGFAFVMSVSPGPGNFLLLASGVNFGYRRSLPLVFGISLGFLTMVFVLGIGLGEILRQVPEVLVALRLICGAYVFYLAWKIAHIRSLGSGAGPAVDEPIGFTQAALFQLVNPKAWAVALILGVSYTDPDNYLTSLIILIAVFAVVNIPTISIWAISGQALRRLLSSDRRLRFFNLFMALLLVGTMVPVLAGVYTF
ncbi:LysE family translocator [Rhodospirillaceae bacterium KN72]|uniref:LysE family translocator n=1 Tax=Pacificispira spongiicola TaxID=2729598 RepID=A0A7Y0HHA2_9PROT|nr:LysE family translocator [Pacificispira spongiicola]NMM45279.1 LysE family translocator [Pacificispira spongiicola]